MKYPWLGNVASFRKRPRARPAADARARRSATRISSSLEGEGQPSPTAGAPISEWEIRPLDTVAEEYVAAAVKAVGRQHA